MGNWHHYDEAIVQLLGYLPSNLEEAVTALSTAPKVDFLLTYLMEIQREITLHSVFDSPAILPSNYDVLINDIDQDDLVKIAKQFFNPNSEICGLLADARSNKPEFPVIGTIYGVNHRIFVPMLAQKKNSSEE